MINMGLVFNNGNFTDYIKNIIYGPLSQYSPILLFLSAAVSTLFALISGYAYYRFVKKQEISDMVIGEFNKLERKVKLDEYIAKKERERQEIVRWANPILEASSDLNGRLLNILKHDGYLALNKDFKNQSWSISYEYFMMSTLYVFAQYFCWIRMLQKEFNFELFDSQKDKSEFFIKLNKVSQTLSGFPPYHGSGDVQVFRVQQRALGELMIASFDGNVRCLTYPEFISHMKDPDFSKYFDPLIHLLDNLERDGGRWNRLSATQCSLDELINFCDNVFNLKMESYYGKRE